MFNYIKKVKLNKFLTEWNKIKYLNYDNLLKRCKENNIDLLEYKKKCLHCCFGNSGTNYDYDIIEYKFSKDSLLCKVKKELASIDKKIKLKAIKSKGYNVEVVDFIEGNKLIKNDVDYLEKCINSDITRLMDDDILSYTVIDKLKTNIYTGIETINNLTKFEFEDEDIILKIECDEFRIFGSNFLVIRNDKIICIYYCIYD